jgi:hypothetical protein
VAGSIRLLDMMGLKTDSLLLSPSALFVDPNLVRPYSLELQK